MPKSPLIESLGLDPSVKVDAENAVIHGVKLLGSESRNNRHYLASAMQDSVTLSSEKPVYVESHVDDEQKKPTSRNGVIRNARRENGSNLGDWHLVKSHASTPFILETAARFPGNFALSHEVRDYEATTNRDGILEVSRIRNLGDYALVCEGGTNKSLFEHKEEPVSAEIKTAAELKATYPKLIEEIVLGETATAKECTATIQKELASTIADRDKWEAEFHKLEQEVQSYRDREEDAKKEKDILSLASATVGESFKVSESLLATLKKLDAEGYKQCLTEIALAKKAAVTEPEPAGSTSGLSYQLAGEMPINRIGKFNRR